MATVSDIITTALRQLSITGSGRSPSAAQVSDGLSCLNGLYDQWLSQGMFGKLDPVRIDKDTSTAGGVLLIKKVPCVVTNLLQVTTEFSAVSCPDDLAAIRITTEFDGVRESWIYDGVNGAWVALHGLLISSEAPLSSRSSSGLSACLAMNFASEFGIDVPAHVMRQARAFISTLSRRLSQTPGVGAALYF
jgi:hypothetical protein